MSDPLRSSVRAFVLEVLAESEVIDRLRVQLAVPASGPALDYEDATTFGARFGVDARTVRRWIAKGLPVVRTSKRHVRVKVQEGIAWIEAGHARARPRMRNVRKPTEKEAA